MAASCGTIWGLFHLLWFQFNMEKKKPLDHLLFLKTNYYQRWIRFMRQDNTAHVVQASCRFYSHKVSRPSSRSSSWELRDEAQIPAALKPTSFKTSGKKLTHGEKNVSKARVRVLICQPLSVIGSLIRKEKLHGFSLSFCGDTRSESEWVFLRVQNKVWRQSPAANHSAPPWNTI